MKSNYCPFSIGGISASFKDYFLANKVLIFILGFCFVLTAAYAFYFKIQPAVDARAYDRIAQNIAGGFGYRENLDKDLAYDYAIARVGPLYEYFLAGIYKIFGHSYAAVWLIQALLHTLAAWFIYLTAFLVFLNSDSRKKIAVLAAAIVAFYPDLIEISAMLMSETLYLFLLCLVLWLFFRYLANPGWGAMLILAVFLGLAVLARPPVIFFIPIILFYFLKKKQLLKAGIFLIVLLIVFAPWTVRNYVVYQEFMPLGAAGNFNFWIGNYHGGNGEQGPTVEQMQFESTHPVREINGESMRQFKNFLVQYPGEFIKLTLLRINKYFSFVRPIGFWFYQRGIGQVLVLTSSALASIFLFIFGFAGFWQSIKKKKENLYYLAAFTLTTPLILFITVVETRYRFQIYPLLAIFAAFFAVQLFDRTDKRWWRNKVLWIICIVFSANGLIDFVLNLNRVKEKIGNIF